MRSRRNRWNGWRVPGVDGAQGGVVTAHRPRAEEAVLARLDRRTRFVLVGPEVRRDREPRLRIDGHASTVARSAPGLQADVDFLAPKANLGRKLRRRDTRSARVDAQASVTKAFTRVSTFFCISFSNLSAVYSPAATWEIT